MNIHSSAAPTTHQDFLEITSASQIPLKTAANILARHLGASPTVFQDILERDFHSHHPYFDRGTDPNDDHVYEHDIYEFIDQCCNYLGHSRRGYDESNPEFHATVALGVDYEVSNRPCIQLQLEHDEFNQPVKLTPETAFQLASQIKRLAELAIAQRATIQELYPASVINEVPEHRRPHFLSIVAAVEASRMS